MKPMAGAWIAASMTISALGGCATPPPPGEPAAAAKARAMAPATDKATLYFC